MDFTVVQYLLPTTHLWKRRNTPWSITSSLQLSVCRDSLKEEPELVPGYPHCMQQLLKLFHISQKAYHASYLHLDEHQRKSL